MSYIINIEKAAKENKNFRQVLHTAKFSQLVLMSIKPQEEIGEEIHELDQFIKIEAGRGKTILNGEETIVENGSAIVIPAGTKHNLINDSPTEPLKIYTIYSPPEHRDGTVHKTKDDAEADTEDHFKGF